MKMTSTPTEKRFHSLSLRLPLLFVISSVLIAALIIAVVYARFQRRTIDEYTRMAKGVTNLMAHEIRADHVDEYIEKNFELDEYLEILDRFCDLKDNYPDVYYMYVYRFMEDGGHVVFDIDVGEDEPGDAPGTVYELDPAFVPYRDDLCAGREIPALAAETTYGYLLTYVRPIFDSEGNYQCHACVDFSMDYLHEQDVNFIYGVLGILAAVLSLILLLDIYVVRKEITGPITAMSKCTRQFSFFTEQDRRRNVELLKALDIHTKNEIEDLYTASISVMQDSLYNIENLAKAKSDIHERDAEIRQISKTAYRDALTGTGNKAAYNKEVLELTEDIERNDAEFAIVMMDINNLKYVNDAFGHEAGDRYIKGCCRMACDIFKKSPVFRIGGDEFVIILQNEDYAARQEKLLQLTEAFSAAYQREDQDAPERYSASLGMSEYTPSDKSVEQVLKRADEAMYQNKMDFKTAHGSYR